MKMTGKLYTSENGPDRTTDEKYLLCWDQGAVDEPVTEDLYVIGSEAKDGEIKDLTPIRPLKWLLKWRDRFAPRIL